MRASVAISLCSLATLAHAQDPYSSTDNPYTSGTNPSTTSGGSYSSEYADLKSFPHFALIHGVLASFAFVFFFPIGSIIIRLLPIEAAVWIHATFQVTGYIFFIAAAALGIYISREIDFNGFQLIATYHPIIGLLLLALLILQPILGVLHHIFFKRQSRRTFWSYAHIWLGRILITLGIINGGLGLMLADTSFHNEIAYGCCAGLIWLVWLAAAIYGEVKKARKEKRGPPRYKEHSGSELSEMDGVGIYERRDESEVSELRGTSVYAREGERSLPVMYR